MPEWEREAQPSGRIKNRSLARRLKLAALAFPALLVADLAVSPFIGVHAVDATGQFEMDGNIVQNAVSAPPYDWASLFTSAGAKVTPAPSSMFASAFAKDAATPDQTYFNTSNKDINPINTGDPSEWACGPVNNPTAKDDILNAYGAVFQIPAGAPENSGDTVAVFGVERLSNNGDSFAGFWLLKDPAVGCSGSNTFSGHHTNGDILVLTNFTNGGSTASVTVNEWIGGTNATSPQFTTIADGNVCGVSPGGIGGETVCAISNAPGAPGFEASGKCTDASNTITSPWAPTSHDGCEFTEAAVDLTELFAGSVSGPCFSNFMAETRSSQEITAQLKDFAGGLLNTCVQPPVNTTATPGGTQNLPGTTQHDVATVGAVGGAPTPTGSVQFSLCTPSQVTSAGCPSGAGTNVGNPVTLVNGSAQSPNVSGVTSPNTLAIGKYCWGAQYTPDVASQNRYLPSYGTDASGECFSVVKATPTIATQVSVTGNGDLGNSTLGDTATLTNSIGSLSGETVSFSLWGPYASGVTPTCTGTPAFTTSGTLSGAPNTWTATTSQTFAPTAVGHYVWTASYGGDALNNSVAEPCNGANESTTIVTPSLSVTKTADHATVSAGDQIGFVITVNNASGAGPARSVTLTDPLPGDTDAAGISWSVATQPSQGSCSISGSPPSQTLSCAFGDIAAGSSVQVHVVSATTASNCETYVNSATASASNLTTNNGRVSSNQASTTVQCPDVTVVKTADNATVTAGSPIGFGIKVSNAGPGTAKNVALTDPLPAGTAVFWSIDSQTGTACTITGSLGAQTLSCTIGTMLPNTHYDVHITSATTPADCTQYLNTASVTLSNENGGPFTSQATTTVQCPGLFIHKTADASPVTVGDPVGFMITVGNSGPGTATAVSMSDPLPGGTGVNWSIASQTASACTISGSTGSQTLSCTIGDMVALQTYSIHITSSTSFDSHAAYPFSLPNTATARASNAPPVSDSATIVVQAPLLTVTKTPDTTPVTVGDTIGFTIAVSNSDAAGTGTAKAVMLHDPLPGGSGVSWSVNSQPASGTCSISGAAGSQVLDCSLGDMAPGDSLSVHITSGTSFDSHATYPLTLPNTATATPSNGNPASGSGSIVIRAPLLSVVKTADASPVSTGDPVGFTITVSNSDAADTGIARAVTLNDPLPAGSGVDWSIDLQPAAGSCSISGSAGSQVLSCSLGDMAPGDSLTMHIASSTSFDSGASYPLTLDNTATATPANGNPASGHDAIVVQAPDISVVKTADASPVSTGDKVGFTITVSNSDAANTGTAKDVVLNDPLPSGSSVIWSIDSGPSQGSCDPLGTTAPQTLHCNLGDIPPGDSVTLHITATTSFDSHATYPLTLPNTATATPSNGNPASGHDSIVVQAPALTVVKKADNPAVTAGDTIGFTITVSNSDAQGTGVARSVTLNDPLPGGSGAFWSINQQPGQGSCSIAGVAGSQTLTCALGDMQPGDSLSIHITSATKQVTSETYPQTLNNVATATPTNGNPASGNDAINIVASGVLALPPTGQPFPWIGLIALLGGVAFFAGGLRARFRRRHA